MEAAGFSGICRYDWRKTEHATLDDYSQSYIPHLKKEEGTLISLNVEATKIYPNPSISKDTFKVPWFRTCPNCGKDKGNLEFVICDECSWFRTCPNCGKDKGNFEFVICDECYLLNERRNE